MTPTPAGFEIRAAVPADAPALGVLIAASARALAAGDYSRDQIEAALEGAWGVDSQLLRDGTCFIAGAEGAIVGCGGWSFRQTLFGGDAAATREPARLDPQRDPARIRAFFVHPGWARRGIGRALLERCESEAHRRGFRAATLLATLPGQRFYRALGYAGDERVVYPLPRGLTIEFVPMSKPELRP